MKEWYRLGMIRNNKQGVALPLVLVFIVISHLIFFGIIRLNASKIKSLQLLQNEYLGKIQQTMSRHHLDVDNHPQLQQLQHKIIEGIDYLTNRSINHLDNLQWIQSGDYSGVLEFEFEKTKGQLVYFTEIYMDQSLLSFDNLHDYLPVSGEITERQELLPFSEVHTQLEQTEIIKIKTYLAAMEANGYEIWDEWMDTYTDRWMYNYAGPQLYQFNTGTVTIDATPYQYIMTSRLLDQPYLKKTYHQLDNGRYFIKWLGFVLVKA